MRTPAKAMPSGALGKGTNRPPDDESKADRLVHILSLTVFTLSVSFFSVVTTISYFEPDFFDRMLLADIERTNVDPITVGATAKPSEEIVVDPMPVAHIVRPRELQPADFSIVMVFGDEAHLATPGEIWRVKPGMIVPGLGKVLAIEEDERGGTIKTENAILTGVPN